MIQLYILLQIFILTQQTAFELSSQPPADSRLNLVVEVFRHGARYPIYNALDSDQQDKEELSSTGMRQHYQLGLALRKKYIEEQSFLSDRFDSNEMYIFSTNVNRTIMSAFSQLQGLYPLNYGPEIPQNLYNPSIIDPPYANKQQQIAGNFALDSGQQVFPIHTMDNSKNKQLKGYDSGCPNSKFWTQANRNNENWQQVTALYNDTLKQLADKHNIPKEKYNSIEYASQWMDTLIADVYNGRNTTAYDETFYKDMELLTNTVSHLLLFQTKQQKLVTVTPFFQELLAYFDNNINKLSSKKWYMLSAHDTTLQSVQQGLDFTNWECLVEYKKTGKQQENCDIYFPKFASNIIFELRHNVTDHSYFVMILFNGVYQNICGENSTTCSLDKFKSFLKNKMVSDFDEQCGITTSVQKAAGWAIAVPILFILGFFAGLAWLYSMMRKVKIVRQKQIFLQEENSV